MTDAHRPQRLDSTDRPRFVCAACGVTYPCLEAHQRAVRHALERQWTTTTRT